MTTHVVHLLRHLAAAGTEKKLYHLIRASSAATDTRHTVIAFDTDKTLADDFRALPNTDLITLDISSMPSNLSTLSRWAKGVLPVARKLGKIDIAHAWNEGMIPMLIPLNAANSSIRGNVMSVENALALSAPKDTALSYKALTKVMSGFSKIRNTAIVTLSADMKEGLASHGYKDSLIKVIMNGVDIDHFKPVAGAKESLNAELGIPQGSHIIGMAARHTPNTEAASKDIPTFLRAAAALERKFPALFAQSHFVICGHATDNGELRVLADSLGIGDRVHILGPRNDMARQYSAWTVSNMCSLREPFGLVAAESMACKTPVVVTDVDLLPYIVGDAGMAVPVRAPEARADAWEKLLSMPDNQKQALGNMARKRASVHFDNARMSREFTDAYDALLNKADKMPRVRQALYNSIARYSHF